VRVDIATYYELHCFILKDLLGFISKGSVWSMNNVLHIITYSTGIWFG
jgi:hypothetical protein